MKADCLAIVNERNETLWTRSATYLLEFAAQALTQLREESHGVLTLIKSFTNEQGKEQFVEILTPWVDACSRAQSRGLDAPSMAVIEIWHDKEPHFGLGGIPDTIDLSKFDKCASILVPDEGFSNDSALDVAFEASQNIDSAWRPGKSCRSSSVGDVFIFKAPETENAYAIASSGFKPVQVLPA